MSEDPGDIPASGERNLVRALSEARTLPAEALDRAARQPARIVEPVLDALGKAAAGGALSPADENLLFWGIHALAQARESRLCAPLLRLLRRPIEVLDPLLGDAVTATLPRVMASVFDGEPGPLEAAILDPKADEFARWSLLRALAFLTTEDRIERERALGLLRRFEADRPARAGDAGWAGWAEAIALLGFAEMSDAVSAARSDARLLDDVTDPAWFAATLADAVARPADRSRFDPTIFGYVEDAVAELDAMLAASDPEAEPEQPVRNPLRDVGRNDPCPCGSGRKFKKCCLAA